MKNQLRALLPIHALRESRALRVVHEQTAAHERAVAAQKKAADDQTRLHRESKEALAGIAGEGSMRAVDAQWTIHVAATLEQRADAYDELIPQLADESRRALESVREARAAHAARVRGHHKVREASRRVSARDELAQNAELEQRADDDFSPRWFANRTPAPSP